MKLVMFDMDGTLIDTQAMILEQMSAAFTSLGLEPPAPEHSRRVIGLSLPVALSRLLGTTDSAMIEKLAQAYRTHYHDALAAAPARMGAQEGLFDGARATLDLLKARPDTLLGIATGKGLSGVHRLIRLHGIAQHFVTLQTPDHNPSKPHPGMMLRAMQETGAAAERTCIVGDTTFDMEMGKAAGTRTIGVGWGYHERDELLAAGADIVVEDYADLPAVIDRLIDTPAEP